MTEYSLSSSPPCGSSAKIEFLPHAANKDGGFFSTPSRANARMRRDRLYTNVRSNKSHSRSRPVKVQVHCRRKDDGNARLIGPTLAIN